METFCINYFMGLHSQDLLELLIVCPPQGVRVTGCHSPGDEDLYSLEHSVRKEGICLVQIMEGGVRVFSNVVMLEVTIHCSFYTAAKIILDISILGTSAAQHLVIIQLSRGFPKLYLVYYLGIYISFILWTTSLIETIDHEHNLM